MSKELKFEDISMIDFIRMAKKNGYEVQVNKDVDRIGQLEAENIKLKKDIALLEELDGAYHNALAIECLKEVKEFNAHCIYSNLKIDNFIDNKIKELEEE